MKKNQGVKAKIHSPDCRILEKGMLNDIWFLVQHVSNALQELNKGKETLLSLRRHFEILITVI